MGDRSIALWVLLGVLFATSSAAAQKYTYPTPASQTQPYVNDPVYTEPKTPKVSSHRGFQGGFNLGVPVFLDVDSNVVRPGADLHAYGGYDIGYVMFGLDLGAMWTPIDLNRVPEVPPGINPGRSPVTRLYFSPEVRVQVPNKSPILPYLAAAFDVNWWRFKETGFACGYWYCTQVKVFRFTPGFTGKFGVAFRAGSGTYIDLGIKYSYSGAGDFFLRKQQWVTPYLGFLLR